MADFFIKRPILSICLSVIIVLLGAFSILRLPISEYPEVYLQPACRKACESQEQ